ncbi:MAG TPA: GNAT family N-acetyltransferase, partial [Lacipirellula sp.]
MSVDELLADCENARAFRIRRAEERRDWRALRMLLPHAVHHGCGCDAFVATDDAAARRVIGALAIEPQMRLQPYRGPRVALHVIPPWRRLGVGRSLLNAAAAISVARKAEALYAWSKLRPDSDEAAAWRGVGFTHAIEYLLTRVEAARVIEKLTPLVDALQQRGHIPAKARIIPLEKANPKEVVRLVTTYLAGVGTEPVLERRIVGRHPKPLEPRLSRALLYQDRIVGVMLGSPIDPRVGLIEANVIHPAVRGGWANVWLKLETTRDAQAAGYDAFLYETHSQHAD